MSDYSAVVALPNAKQGDYWPPSATGAGKVLFGPITIDGGVPDETMTRVILTFSRNARRFIVDSEVGANALAVITNAATWQFEIPRIDAFLPVAGDWTWDLAVYHTGAEKPLTPYKGTITVYADV